MDVKLMHRQGASIREIARRTRLSRTTVRKILSQRVPKPYGPRPPRPSKLDPFVAYLAEALAARPWVRATTLYGEVAERGFGGHYEAVKCWVRQARQQEQARRRACVRFETGPGVEAQFDWKGPVSGLLAGEPGRRVWIFRFVLAYSRRRWTRAVAETTGPVLLALLREVFELLGGVPQRLVFDNAKTAVLRPRPALVLQPAFAAFCGHYGCEPAPALPYSPQRKGKVERGLLDLERSPMLHATYPDLAALQAALAADDAAHAERIVSTTGARPAERLARELPYLLPLPAGGFDPRVPESRHVLADCTVSYHAAFYSVPHRLVGSRVTVKADPLRDVLEIFSGADRVARHALVGKGQRSLAEEHLAALRRPRWERARQTVASPAIVSHPQAALHGLVAWPRVDVPLRPIEEYAVAAAGGRP